MDSDNDILYNLMNATSQIMMGDDIIPYREAWEQK